MNQDDYKLEPWKQYDVSDNGTYAPLGSNPKIHVEASVFQTGSNPLHPWVQGYILHDLMPGDELVRARRVLICDIHEPISSLNKID